MIEENHQLMVEIQNLKIENTKLMKEKRTYREEHAQNKQLQVAVKQHLKEITKIKEKN